MSRNAKIVGITVIVLFFTVSVLAWLNQSYMAERKAIQQSGTFVISADGSQYKVMMDDLEDIGFSIIEASYKTNLMPAEKKQYTGVSLKSVLDYVGADYSGAKSLSFSAADGYASAAPIAHALDEANCFIVVKEAGSPLGTKESGGTGPYMVVFAKDRYSQRWCKYLLEITIN